MKASISVRSPVVLGLISLGCLLAALGCKPQGAETSGAAHGLPPDGQLASLPIGELAGAATLRSSDEVPNPFSGDAAAIAEGHRLFVAMNCAGCHGYNAKGNMGPDLTDAYWRYGGTPAAIYNSIYAGRPLGMPAWGRAIPTQDIWKVVAFIQSLGGGVAWNQYHRGLQGDHDVTSMAAESNGALGVLDSPSGITALAGEEASAASAPASAPASALPDP